MQMISDNAINDVCFDNNGSTVAQRETVRVVDSGAMEKFTDPAQFAII